MEEKERALPGKPRLLKNLQRTVSELLTRDPRLSPEEKKGLRLAAKRFVRDEASPLAPAEIARQFDTEDRIMHRVLAYLAQTDTAKRNNLSWQG